MSTSRNRLGATVPQVEPVRLPQKQQKRGNRRRAARLLFYLCIGIIYTAMAVYAIIFVSSRIFFAESIVTSSAGDPNLGKIIIERDLEACEQITFDNDTGQVIDRSTHCDNVIRDANGVPVPIGTTHRLGAIGKWFSGQ